MGINCKPTMMPLAGMLKQIEVEKEREAQKKRASNKETKHNK